MSYHTAWLKVHYPAEFMAAVLSSDMDNTDKVVNFLDEARALKIRVLSPNVNDSVYMFDALDDGAIRYGLGAIKGVGRGACENIVAERERGGRYADLLDFCQRIDAQKINKRVLEALINSGALDDLAPTRASLAAQLPEVVKAAEQAARDRLAGQNDMFGAASPVAPKLELPVVDEWPLEQRLAGERETLGHYLSGHPTDPWKAQLLQLATCPLGEVEQKYQPPKMRPRKDDDGDNRFRRGPDTPWTIAGQVVGLRKRGDTMAFVQIEDWSGRIEASFFRDAFVEFGPLLVRDAILVIEGGLSFDDFSNAHQLRARSVVTLEQACERFARSIRIVLNGVDATFVDTLRTTLLAYRGGQTPLRLAYASAAGRADIDLGSDWRVRAGPDLMRALNRLPGVKSAELLLTRATSAN